MKKGNNIFFLSAIIFLLFVSSFFLLKKTSQSKSTKLEYEEVKEYVKRKNFEALSPVYQSMLKKMIADAKADPSNLYNKSMACWAPDTDPKIVEAFYEAGENLRSSLAVGPEKFRIFNNWTNTANGNISGQGTPTTLTWSYVPDGTTISGNCAGEPNANSDLIGFLNGIYGAPTVSGDYTTAPWHTTFVNMFTAWSQVSGLTFVYEPNDDGLPYAAGNGANSGVLGVRGDHRIGGHPIDGNSGVLACNYFPNVGDMIIDTDDNFYSNNPGLGTLNVLTHEIGHGLGFEHVCPTSQTKLMEPFISTAFTGPQEDDILAVNRNYGDTDENNNTSGSATDLGTLTVPSITTRDTRSIDDNSDIDFYQFTTTIASDVSISMTPTGSTYLEGAQNSNGSCSSGSNFNALTVSNLEVALIAGNGSTVLENGAINPAGISESVFRSLAAGTYYIRTQQTGAVNSVQMYDLEIETIDVPVTIPTANYSFTPSSPIEFCPGNQATISFTDASTGAPSSWAWTLSGAGVSPTSSTDQNPSVTVTTSGTLSATLVASNSLGSSPAFNNTVQVNELAVSAPQCQVTPCLLFDGGPYSSFHYADACYLGCPSVAVNFQAWENESYRLTGLNAGTNYTFEFCNGYDIANWEAIITVGQYNLAGNDAVPNSQIAAAEGCSINFTCPTDGDYIVVISGKNNCGGAENQTNNGFLTFQCNGATCPSPCGDTFTDRGGENFNYTNNFNATYVICPDIVGQAVEAVFTAFDIEGDTDGNSPTDCYDVLNIYDGNSTSAPQIGGEYCNTPGPGTPGTVTSTAANGCLTFEFTSDPGVTDPGWSAQISCIGGPACPPDFAGGNALTGTASGTLDFETDGTIESTQIVSAGATVDYDSGTEITLNPGFETVLNAVFTAFIDGCGGTAINEPFNNIQNNIIVLEGSKNDYLSINVLQSK